MSEKVEKTEENDNENQSCNKIRETSFETACDNVCDNACDNVCDNACDNVCDNACEKACENAYDNVSEKLNEEELSDNIGDTVFSKHWTFQCLKKALDVINNESNISDSPIELDPEAEEELCLLWDMSANDHVGRFLNDSLAIELFEGIIAKTNSPRLAEISAGILANIVSNTTICVAISNREGFKELILSSLQSSDTPFVLQIIRLISTALSDSHVRESWLGLVEQSASDFFTTAQHILSNCLNCDVLKALQKLIYKIIYFKESLILKWIDTDKHNLCVKSLFQSSQEILKENDDNIDCIDYFWLILHLLSLYFGDNFFQTYLKPIENDFQNLLNNYIIESFGESIDFLIPHNRAACLAGALSIFNIIIQQSSTSLDLIKNNSDLVETLTNLQTTCHQSIDYQSTDELNQSFYIIKDNLKVIIKVVSEKTCM